jgi:anti-sigma factor RsiW
MTHLSSEQISDWILGDRSPHAEQHLETCDQCHQEVARLHEGLVAFKQSVHQWAAQPVQERLEVSQSRPQSRQWWTWAVATAAAMSVALLPLYLDVREAQQTRAKAEDSLLLDQVNARLSRTVPQSMEQLMKLMDEGKEGLQ